ncbi:MAG TPA: peptidoglycan-binding domain-containing protein [Solirubrobacterales bacterium]|nr:peptidoglycan-binding domain-containing protein [Solirubrobacterales bacterium]
MRSKPRIRGGAALAALAAALVVLLAPGSSAAEPGGAGQFENGPTLGNSPFDRQGMWVWYVSRSESGSVSAILARARRFDIGTVYIKSGDGGGNWSQFNSALVGALHRGGLDVCAWQFVYGDHPIAEAKVGAAAVEKGADCLVIDAEADYEGKYASADRYVRALRARIGATFPLSLAGFPYVDYHPSFPYSVFFGPGGATYNQPQMYWKTIGTSVRAVYEHTYLFNRIWGHPIYPIGQTYEAPGAVSLRLFRRFAASYGGLPPSWWDWQETSGREWGALGAESALRPLPGYRQEVTHPLLKRGSRGDMVVWAQEHLVPAGATNLPVTGLYGRKTYGAVRAFQLDHGLRADGQIGTETWEALLKFTPIRVSWGGASTRLRGGARPLAASRPLSASLPAKAYEIPPKR